MIRTARIRAGVILALLIAVPLTLPARTPVGTGHSPVAEAGPGIDLLVWRDGAAIRATRAAASGSPLDLPPLHLGSSSSPVDPVVAWDGEAFVVVWADGASLHARRVAVDGSQSAVSSLTISQSAIGGDLAITGLGDGVAIVMAGPLFATLYVQSGRWNSEFPSAGGTTHEDAADLALESLGSELVRASIGRTADAACGDPTCLMVRVGSATPHGPVSFEAEAGTLSSSRRDSAVFGWYDLGDPIRLRLRRVASSGAVEGALPLRYPFGLRLHDGTGLFAAGGRVRALLDEQLALREATLIDVESGASIGAILPHSGFAVTETTAGPGAIAIHPPVSHRFDVAARPVFAGTSSAWVKIENRGPDSPEAVHLWVGGRVRSFSALFRGELVESGPVSLLRFDGTLHKGAGFEVLLWFEEPIDPERFEAWAFAAGTDLDATNNRIGPPIEPDLEPEPERMRRRLAGRSAP